ADRPPPRVQEEPLRHPALLLEGLGGGSLLAAGGQPRRLPLVARGGVARRPDLRLAAPAVVLLGAPALRRGAVGLDHLLAPSLRGGPPPRLGARARRGVGGAAGRRLVGGPSEGDGV